MNRNSISLAQLQKIKLKQNNPTQARTVNMLVTQSCLTVKQWTVAHQAPLSMGSLFLLWVLSAVQRDQKE